MPVLGGGKAPQQVFMVFCKYLISKKKEILSILVVVHFRYFCSICWYLCVIKVV